MRKLFLFIVLAVTSMAVADEKEVVNYSFDDDTHPSLTLGTRTSADYSHISVATSTPFMNLYSNTNATTMGTTIVSLGSEDLSNKTWTLTFRWAGIAGGLGKIGETILKDDLGTELFTITDAATGSNTTMALTYGASGSVDLPCAAHDKTNRYKESIADSYNTDAYWCLFSVTGNPDDGVLLTIRQNGVEILKDAVLSKDNLSPYRLTLKPGNGGAVGMDELLLTYTVDHEVVQTPTAEYTAVNGISRTITASCTTEGAVLYHSLNGLDWTEGATVTVSESGPVYFKAVKGAVESDLLVFEAQAGTMIQLNQPVLTRVSDTEVIVTSDQSDILLRPAVRIAYSYGSQSGFLNDGESLTIEEDAVISAYSVAEGYDISEQVYLEVALFPFPSDKRVVHQSFANGWSEYAWGAETVVSERTYAVLLLDGTAWSEEVLLWKDGEFGLRYTGTWYVSSYPGTWFLIRSLHKGDIIVFDTSDIPSMDAVNATYIPKCSYKNHYSYLVEEDGDVEVSLTKNALDPMKYFYGIDVYSSYERPTCAAPTDFVVSDITGSSALLSWTANNGESEWLLAYTKTTGIYNFISVTENPYRLEGLEPNTEYFVNVAAKCSASDLSDWWSDIDLSFSTIEPAICTAPSNLTFSNVTETSVDLDWTPGALETQWILNWKTSEDAGFIFGKMVDEHPYTLDGLEPGTTYQLNVMAFCDPDLSTESNTIEITTSKPQAINQVDNRKSTIENRKFIRDGQLLILRGGKIFNAQGVEIK